MTSMPPPRLRRTTLWTVLGLLLLTGMVLPAARGDEAANLERLRSMPRERRQALMEALGRFDALSREQKAAIRRLDADLEALPLDEQVRYQAALGRYHRWLERLHPDQRRQIEAAASDDERMGVITRIRQDQRKNAPKTDGTIGSLGVKPTDLITVNPFLLAYWIKVWNVLDPEEQAEINRLPVAQRFAELNKAGAQHKLRHTPPSAALKNKLEEHVALFEKTGQTLPPGLLKRVEPAKTKTDTIKPKGRAGAPFQGRLLGALYLAEIDPPKVAPAHLDRFEASIPGWLRESLDPLPADAARRRLAVLYRVAYPEPEEMPVARPKADPSAIKPGGPPSDKNAGPPAPVPKSAPSAPPGETPF